MLTSMLNFTVPVFCTIINWQRPANRPRREIAEHYQDKDAYELRIGRRGSIKKRLHTTDISR